MENFFLENNKAMILWEFATQLDKQVLANQPDIAVIDKNQKSALVKYSYTKRQNVRKKEHENLKKYLSRGTREVK